MGHCACSHVALSRRIAFSVFPELLSPREIQCFALDVKKDVVIMLMWVGSSECATSTVLDSMDEDRVAVPCPRGPCCLAQSFNACGARCPFCVQPLREFAESPVLLVFLMDTQ